MVGLRLILNFGFEYFFKISHKSWYILKWMTFSISLVHMLHLINILFTSRVCQQGQTEPHWDLLAKPEQHSLLQLYSEFKQFFNCANFFQNDQRTSEVCKAVLVSCYVKLHLQNKLGSTWIDKDAHCLNDIS